MAIVKDTLGLAGEFAVASELCRRGIYAQLTLGNRKRTDLLIESDKGMIRVQVKAKQAKVWPASKGVHGTNIVLVLVDYQGKAVTARPDFYILAPDDWANVVKVALIDTGKVAQGLVTLDENNVPKWTKDGWIGMSLRAEQVVVYKEAWDGVLKMVETLALPSLPEKKRGARRDLPI